MPTNDYPSGSTPYEQILNDPDVNLLTPPNLVAVEPFPDMSVKLQSHGDGAIKATRIENKVAGVWLKVIFASENFRFSPGMKVMVHGKQFGMPWAKEVQEFEGRRFILVPEKEIMVIDRRVS